jgi:hypothetical protein
MKTAMLLVTLCVFLAGLAIGWRHVRIGGLYLLLLLMVVFAVVDFAVDRILVWPNKYWLIVDLVAGQFGYLTGAAISMIKSSRKDREGRDPD